MTELGLRATLIAALIVGLSFVFVPQAYGAVITVTTTVDEDLNPGAGCSLREAVIAANTDAAYGGCAAGSGADTIQLSDGTYTLTLGSQLTVTSPITIASLSGNRDAVIIQATTTANSVNYRVIGVESTGTLTLTAVTVRHGGQSFFPLDGGGGVRNEGTLTVNNSVITANRASAGAGIFSSGTLTINAGNINNNVAWLQGGGLLVSGNTTITNVTRIEYNTALTGGGIYKGGATTSIDLSGTLVRFNTGTAGVGGIHHNLGILSANVLLLEFNTGGGYLNDGSPSIGGFASSCIVGNDDTAVIDTSSDNITDVAFTWWGSAAGPYTGANTSIGDSISGFVSSSLNQNMPIDLMCGTCTSVSTVTGGRDIRTCSPGTAD